MIETDKRKLYLPVLNYLLCIGWGVGEEGNLSIAGSYRDLNHMYPQSELDTFKFSETSNKKQLKLEMLKQVLL